MACRDSATEADVITTWCEAGERGDADRAAQCLSSEVELVSPITEQFRFVGRAQVHDLLRAAFDVIDDITFVSRLGHGDSYALAYRARIGRQVLEEAQHLRVDAGMITRITLFIRPLPALTALVRTLGPQLARQQHRSGLALLLAGATAPLHAMTRIGDRGVVPLVAPPRR